MRDIKFREFRRGAMYYDFSLPFNENVDLNEQIEVIQENSKLMQYTGLNDKNGASIYEGDIVEYEYDKNKYRVEFINGSFELRRFYKNIINLSFIDCDYGKEIQVIGNIHENPELLINKKE